MNGKREASRGLALVLKNRRAASNRANFEPLLLYSSVFILSLGWRLLGLEPLSTYFSHVVQQQRWELKAGGRQHERRCMAETKDLPRLCPSRLGKQPSPQANSSSAMTCLPSVSFPHCSEYQHIPSCCIIIQINENKTIASNRKLSLCGELLMLEAGEMSSFDMRRCVMLPFHLIAISKWGPPPFYGHPPLQRWKQSSLKWVAGFSDTAE